MLYNSGIKQIYTYISISIISTMIKNTISIKRDYFFNTEKTFKIYFRFQIKYRKNYNSPVILLLFYDFKKKTN